MSKRDYTGIPIPSVIDPPESMQMTLCIPKNRDHMTAFFGALYELTMWNSWEQNGTTQGKEVAAVWWRYYLSWQREMNDIECEDGMSNCCTEPAITRRINPETGLIEQSTNNGATWTPIPNGLQSIIVQPIPPVTSGVAATKCDAATNLAGQIDVWITQVSNDFDTASSLVEFGLAVIGAIIGAVLVVVTGGGLAPVEAMLLAAMGAAFAAAWGAGKAVFDAYWSVEIRDQILCSAYCNISADGSFTDADFSAFFTDLNVNLPPSPAKMLFLGFLSSVGKEGLNAMAASGMSADSDCGDCPCSTCVDKFHIYNIGGGVEGGVIIDAGDNFVTVRSQLFGARNSLCISTGDAGKCCALVSTEVVEGTYTDYIDGIACGFPPVVGNLQFNINITQQHNTFAAFHDGGSAFAIKFTFAE